MSKEKHIPNFESPMKGTFPDPNKIICKDCVFRDKTVVNIFGEKKQVGVTKSFCEIYRAPPESNGKPSDVLFQNAKCKYYVKEDAE